MGKISVVINTKNEEKNLPNVFASARRIADEIVVVDTKSEDNTVKLSKKLGARVYVFNKTVNYVEPARNFSIQKAKGEWIFLLDADEEISASLAQRIKKIVKNPKADYFRVPRKNIIFGKWMKYSRWWPDYKIRLFKKGFVSWGDEIHSIPITKGKGADLPLKESLAIIHHNYTNLNEYLERMNTYTSIQANELIESGYKFIWKDLIKKPTAEFLSRFFAGEGYKDGLHGLSLSMLQAFSEVVLYLKVWQEEKFLEQSITSKESIEEFTKVKDELDWWLMESAIKETSFLKSLPKRLKRKVQNAKKKT